MKPAYAMVDDDLVEAFVLVQNERFFFVKKLLPRTPFRRKAYAKISR